MTANGRVWVKREDKEREIVHFFQQLHTGDKCSRPQMDGISFKKLSSSHVSFLEHRFCKKEIKEAVFDIGSDCAPAPYGFPIIFANMFGIC